MSWRDFIQTTAMLLALLLFVYFTRDRQVVSRRYEHTPPVQTYDGGVMPVKECPGGCKLPARCNPNTGHCEAQAHSERFYLVDYGEPDPGVTPLDR